MSTIELIKVMLRNLIAQFNSKQFYFLFFNSFLFVNVYNWTDKGDAEEPDCCQVQDNPEADRDNPDEAKAAALALSGC